MGKLKKLTILKIGGSLITLKDRPMTLNRRAVKSVARALRRSGLPNSKENLFVVHGGGSFGHYWAVRHGLSRDPRHVSPLSTSRTSFAMLQLHTKLLSAFMNEGVCTKTYLPSELLKGQNGDLNDRCIDQFQYCFSIGLIPVSFGDARISDKGTSIVSGDTITEAIVKKIGADRVIFAMDVDGIYPSGDLKGEIIRELPENMFLDFNIQKYDVTGGVRAKVDCGFRLAKMGADVMFVNGLKEGRLEKLLRRNRNVKATRIMAFF